MLRVRPARCSPSTETLTRATPLILTGLAAAVAFRARLWNIGAEGQLYAGALAAVAVGGGAIRPAYVLVPARAAGRRGARARCCCSARCCSRRGSAVDEVVTTLLLNFVVLLFVQMMLEGPMKDPMGLGWPQSVPVARRGRCCRSWSRRCACTGGLILASSPLSSSWI